MIFIERVLKYEIEPALTQMTTNELIQYFNSHSFRAIFTARGNMSFDAVAVLKVNENNGERDVTLSIRDWNRIRDQDCDMIVVMSDDNEIIFRLYYKPSEFIHEYGSLTMRLSSMNY